MIILLYLSFKIIQFEYNKYNISLYIKGQKGVVNNIKTYLDETTWTIKYLNTKAFKNKILKSDDWMKMKWEKVIILTSEKVYKKFSWKKVIKNLDEIKDEKKYDITSTMSNFEKWIYFLLNKNVK